RRHTRWPRDWSSDVCSSDLESFDASENLPKEGPRQVAFGQLQDEVPGMPNEAPAGLEEPLLETQNSMRAPSSTTRFGGMLKKSEIGRASCRERGCVVGVGGG